MTYQQPFTRVVHKRYSCRNYNDNPISKSTFHDLESYTANLPSGPFDGPSHFHLIVANEEDRSALNGLGTYGNIKNPVGFVVGATRHVEMDMEDFGFRMEMIVLKATDLDLATCWLGGLFTRSAFVKKIGAAKEEVLPAICAVGYPAAGKSPAEVEQSRRRLGGEALFFADDFTKPLISDQAGEYAYPLEMLRLAPSARNLQPWRIVKQGKNWHFYLQRTQGYHQMVLPAITGISDLQRIDMGIGMAHFETAAHDSSLTGRWQVADPGIQMTNKLMEYSVSWIAAGNGRT